MDNKAVFFDRDGVLNEDIHLLYKIEDVIIPSYTVEAFELLQSFTGKKIVVSNQTVISRGLASEEDVEKLNQYINKQLFDATGCSIDKFYVCPHHPEATLEKYRINCNCRKPKPGMLLQAANDLKINLSQSWMIGDRISDIVAGHRVGCKTILIQTGRHTEKTIISDAMDTTISPGYICAHLLEAVKIIFQQPTTSN